MTTIVSMPGGIGDWSGCCVERISSGMRRTMKAINASEGIPMVRALHAPISKSARAHRRARIDPIPSQIKTTAASACITTPAMMAWEFSCGPFAGAIVCAKIVNGMNRALMQPARNVSEPNMMRPALRSLNSIGTGGGISMFVDASVNYPPKVKINKRSVVPHVFIFRFVAELGREL